MKERVQIRFLGCGDAFGSGGRFNTCFLVDGGGRKFLIDCGATSMVAMRHWEVDPNSIGLILISHLHGDHFGGLPFFLLDAQLISRRKTPLTIAGPPGLEARLEQAMEVLFPGSSRARPKYGLTIIELEAERAHDVEGVKVTPYEVGHPSGAPSYALRVGVGGKTICYSGDTQWTESLGRATRGADLFVCECNFYDKAARYHMNYMTLMGKLGEIGPKKLVLTHMGTDMIARAGDLDHQAAEDGLTLVVE